MSVIPAAEGSLMHYDVNSFGAHDSNPRPVGPKANAHTNALQLPATGNQINEQKYSIQVTRLTLRAQSFHENCAEISLGIARECNDLLC